MPKIFISKFNKIVLPSDWYEARFKDVEEIEGKFGPSYSISFMLRSDGSEKLYKSVYMTQKAFPGNENYPPSKLYTLLKALLGSQPNEDEGIELFDLLNHHCLVHLDTPDGKSYQTLSEFKALSPERAEELNAKYRVLA